MQIDRSSHQKCSIKKAFLKNFAVFTRNTSVGASCNRVAYNFIKKRLQHKCFLMNITKFLRASILKNIGIRLLLNWLWEVIVWNFVSGQSLSKPSWLDNFTKIPVVFKPELQTQYGAYAVFKFNSYDFFWTYVSYVHH